MNTAIGTTPDPVQQAALDQVLADCERALGATRVAAALDEGASMALEEIVVRALGEE
jgi:hypothetical protein